VNDNKELYSKILGVHPPWYVSLVEMRDKEEAITVTVECRPDVRHTCPECGKASPGYDTRRREWRHLDTCQYKTFLVADVPRVRCEKHGVIQIALPWAEPGAGFTSLFEAFVIRWLLEASNSAVARRLQLTWDEVDGVMTRAVRRGMARRKLGAIGKVGIDETSFRKRHEYVTVATDTETGYVLYVGDKRKLESLDGFWELLGPERIPGIRSISMDMWVPYINSVRKHVPGADALICFDRFHVAKILNEAVDTVRKRENKELAAAGEEVPKHTKQVWLQNPENMSKKRLLLFRELVHSTLKAARAWAIKDAARWLWSYASRTWAEKAWKQWIGWAQRSQLEPMKRAACTIRDHLWGILNAVTLHATNAAAESTNAKIQRIKNRACGYRNPERFRNAIYFHLGGLDLYPVASATHTNS